MAKVIVIGLDGVPLDLITSLSKQTSLPNLTRLFQEGVYGRLKSVFPPITAPAWVSFATGKNPGKHGCFDFLKPEGSLAHLKPITTKDIQSQTFYEILEQAGRRTALVNLPASFPPRTAGPTITSLLTRGDQFIFPPELKSEIPELKDYRLAPDAKLLISGRIEDYARDIRELERVRFEVARKLFEREDWDFFFVLFSGSDWVQHHKFTDLMRGALPKESHIVKLYQDFDEYIGWFLNQVEDYADLFIMSDHGFRSLERAFFVNAWLHQEGYLKVTTKGGKPPSTKFEEAREKERSRRLRIDPGQILQFLSSHPLLFKASKSMYEVIKRFLPIEIDLGMKTADVPKTMALSVTSESMGIYINDRGRFRDGIVDPQDYERIREEIIQKLGRLQDGNERDIVEFVKKKEEIYWGPYVKDAPDILFQLKNHQVTSRVISAIFTPYDLDGHAPEGILFAVGPHIKRGESVEASIMDLAPTILHLMGLPIPTDVDGRVLQEIFAPGSEPLRRDIESKPAEPPAEKRSQVITESEEEQIKARLKDLGYLE